MDAIAILVLAAVIVGIGVLAYVRLTGAANVGPVIGTGGGIQEDSPLELDDRL